MAASVHSARRTWRGKLAYETWHPSALAGCLQRGSGRLLEALGDCSAPGHLQRQGSAAELGAARLQRTQRAPRSRGDLGFYLPTLQLGPVDLPKLSIGYRGSAAFAAGGSGGAWPPRDARLVTAWPEHKFIRAVLILPNCEPSWLSPPRQRALPASHSLWQGHL